jgi:tetratricopeptide (TPR) repeat protein
MKKLFKLKSMRTTLPIIVFLSLSFSCDQTKELVSRWQKYVVYKRYGIDVDKRDQIKDWEKEIKKYEKVIEEKITAGIKTAKVYRKIGEAYAGMEMYQPCVEYLDKAIEMGYVNDEILFIQALCKGSIARLHNWKDDYRNDAEEGFLKVLNRNPAYHRAKIELALLYFYAFGSRSGYSINSEKISASQNEYRLKALKLANEYSAQMPEKTDGHIILSGMYGAMGKKKEALKEMQWAVELFQKNYPHDFESRDDYRQDVLNLNRLQGQ